MRAREKNDSATETARVLRVYDMLVAEMALRYPPMPIVTFDATLRVTDTGLLPTLLEIADRICYRTEDPE